MIEQIPVERLPVRRRGGGPHPTGGEALRARVLAERPRIARASRIRELVLGFQDGLLVPLAVVTGLAGADAASATVVVGGLAEAAPGAPWGRAPTSRIRPRTKTPKGTISRCTAARTSSPSRSGSVAA